MIMQEIQPSTWQGGNPPYKFMRYFGRSLGVVGCGVQGARQEVGDPWGQRSWGSRHTYAVQV